MYSERSENYDDKEDLKVIIPAVIDNSEPSLLQNCNEQTELETIYIADVSENSSVFLSDLYTDSKFEVEIKTEKPDIKDEKIDIANLVTARTSTRSALSINPNIFVNTNNIKSASTKIPLIVKHLLSNICQKTTNMKTNVTTDICETGITKNPFSCHVCKLNFLSKPALVTHMHIHRKVKVKVIPKQISCSLCDYKCSSKSSFKTHLRIHTGEKLEKPFSCDMCKLNFATKISVKNHILRKHLGHKPFHCEVCKASFFSKSMLKGHMRIHTGEKPYSCSMCEYKTSLKSVLLYHMRRHTGEKRYSCHICESKFYKYYTLQMHLKSHAGERPFLCDKCHRTYARKSNLFNHMKKHHAKE